MELLFELLLELIVGGTMDGAADKSLPKGVRIVFLILATILYVGFSVFFVWLLCSSDSTTVKVLSAGIVLFFVGTFVYLWRKIAKEK